MEQNKTEFFPQVTISLTEYQDLMMFKVSLFMLLNSIGKYRCVDSSVLFTVAKVIGFELPAEE